jgi:hypothetical protein
MKVDHPKFSGAKKLPLVHLGGETMHNTDRILMEKTDSFHHDHLPIRIGSQKELHIRRFPKMGGYPWVPRNHSF